jgi:hypothetical protein
MAHNNLQEKLDDFRAGHQCEIPELPGAHKEGETWTCPECGSIYVHICDEAEGCFWENEVDVEWD